MKTSARKLDRYRGFSPPPESDTPSWFTDPDWFLAKERELLQRRLIPRPFDLDPCGHLEAPVSRIILSRGGVVFTEKDNGLLRSWARRVPFVNPPFRSEHMELWAPKILAELPRVDGLSFHGPAWTDRKWWHLMVEPDRKRGRCEVDFVEGRLGYGWPGNPLGIGGDGALFPSCTVTWRIR